MNNKFHMTWSTFVVAEFIHSFNGDFGALSCLDIGSGSGEQSAVFRSLGMRVDELDKYEGSATIKDDFLEFKFTSRYDFVLCSHVLEHQRNVGLFLDKIYDVLTEDGLLLLSVPKHSADLLVEGHLNCFRIAYFMQQILYSGFDMRSGKFLSCGGIENSAILPKRHFMDADRTEAGYKWKQVHQERTIINLQQFLEVPNDGWFFHNCKLFENGETFKQGDVVRPRSIERVQLEMIADRWGISFEL